MNIVKPTTDTISTDISIDPTSSLDSARKEASMLLNRCTTMHRPSAVDRIDVG
jgi:hypothetical protein